MNYQDIQRVNSEMTMLNLKGKDYAMVPERVTAFRKLYPEGFITTEILSHDGTVVTMQARVGYIREDGSRVILGTGLAQEVKGKGMVNSTSYIENCETSAVGRALGFLGLGINGGGICSAEELANAVVAQRQMQGEAPVKQTQAPAESEAPKAKTADQYRKEIIALAPKKGADIKAIVGADYKGKKWDQLSADELRDIKQKLAKRSDVDKNNEAVEAEN